MSGSSRFRSPNVRPKPSRSPSPSSCRSRSRMLGRRAEVEPPMQSCRRIAKAKRSSTAMRIVYALGDQGLPFLDKSFPARAGGSDQSACSASTVRSASAASRPSSCWSASWPNWQDERTSGSRDIVGTSTGGIIAIGAGCLAPVRRGGCAELDTKTPRSRFSSATRGSDDARYGPGSEPASLGVTHDGHHGQSSTSRCTRRARTRGGTRRASAASAAVTTTTTTKTGRGATGAGRAGRPGSASSRPSSPGPLAVAVSSPS